MPPEPQPAAAALAASQDGRRHAPAAARNVAPLTAVLAELLPSTGRILEVASGTGQHAAHWARVMPGLVVQPSDSDPAARVSITAWAAEAAAPNLLPPLDLDVTADGWWQAAPGPFVAIVAVNLLHIAPWSATLGLLAGAATLLTANGLLVLYGPFAEDGVLTPASNVAFDTALRARDASWGVRDTANLAAAAGAHGLVLRRRIPMPANNLVLVLEHGRCA